jgi:hypothetical protein
MNAASQSSRTTSLTWNVHQLSLAGVIQCQPSDHGQLGDGVIRSNPGTFEGMQVSEVTVVSLVL